MLTGINYMPGGSVVERCQGWQNIVECALKDYRAPAGVTREPQL